MQSLKMPINSSPCPIRGSLAIAHHLKITDTYAQSGGTMATSGAAASVIENTFDTKDRFIEPAKMVELHTDFKDANNF